MKIILATALAIMSVSSTQAPHARGFCRTIAPMQSAFVRFELPPHTEYVWLTRRGRNLDNDGDGIQEVGQYNAVLLVDERSRRTTAYVTVFRGDKRGGRLCFTVKWWT